MNVNNRFLSHQPNSCLLEQSNHCVVCLLHRDGKRDRPRVSLQLEDLTLALKVQE
jgi:hypothetical protein